MFFSTETMYRSTPQAIMVSAKPDHNLRDSILKGVNGN